MEYIASNDPDQIDPTSFTGLLDDSVVNLQSLARRIDTLQSLLDAIYAPIAKGVTNGDSHDHNGGDGAQIDHGNLSAIGTNTHAQIDTHLAAAAPHSGHAASSHTHTTANITDIAESTYTPTLTNIANLDSTTNAVLRYLRVGNTIHVWGALTVNPTTITTLTQFRATLPVASNLGAAADLTGAGNGKDINESIGIYGDTTNDAALFSFIAGNISGHAIYFNFSYKIL